MRPQFSPIAHVNDRFLQLIDYCGANPYAPVPRPTNTAADIVDRIRFEMGNRAANSIKVVFH